MPNTATLTKAMLADLHKGNAHISLVVCPSNGQVDLTTLDFSSANQLFTLKDTFQLQPSDPTKTDTRIDQFNEIIDSMFEEGDYSMVGNIPSFSTALYDFFYTAGSSITAMKGQDGTTTYSGKGYLGRKEVYASVLVESESKKTAVCFARVRLTVSQPKSDDTTNPSYAQLNGAIVANLKAGEGNFAVLKATA